MSGGSIPEYPINEDSHLTQLGPMYSVRKYGSLIPVSEYLLADYLPTIGPERPPVVPTRYQRMRSHITSAVTSVRLRLGSWVAGVDLSDHDCDC